jgi:MerR family transcriptional regulator, thiopeptide resistance regulator
MLAASYELLSISDASAKTGLSADTLRQYEADGLIRPLRSSRGIRLFTAADVETAKKIAAARRERHGRTRKAP